MILVKEIYIYLCRNYKISSGIDSRNTKSIFNGEGDHDRLN